ncbi:MAG: polyhydroxyalkanoic acid system family protein [Thermoguttaceae bacterium]
MTVTVPHTLGQDEATRRLNEKLTQVKEKHLYDVRDLRETWPDPHTLEFHFKALGFAVDGRCLSRASDVTIDVELPFAAMMVKGMIESQLKSELSQVLQPEKA